MKLLKEDTFICLDCETTGLDLRVDRVIEIAAVKFTFEGIIAKWETLVDPQVPIPQESIDIHHISQEMVSGKPTAEQVLPELIDFLGAHIIIGHSVSFDLDMLKEEAKRAKILTDSLNQVVFIDTLRLARLYGGFATNSLEQLRKNFAIPPETSHRAMGDVLINIEVFKSLTAHYKTTEMVLQKLSQPIEILLMPFGRYKGRPFKEIPTPYLKSLATKNFDQDFLYTVGKELKKRKKEVQFLQAANPFKKLG